MSDFVWRPTDDIVQRANVTRIGRAHGLSGYGELNRRSREEIEWFWDVVVADLGIEFNDAVPSRPGRFTRHRVATSVLVEHPDVIEAAVVGVPDDVKGEEIWCFCVLGDGVQPDDATRASISAHVAHRLGGPFRPGAVKFVTELPRTRNAKILRRAVRAAALGKDPGDLSNLENPSALDEIAAAR